MCKNYELQVEKSLPGEKYEMQETGQKKPIEICEERKHDSNSGKG